MFGFVIGFILSVVGVITLSFVLSVYYYFGGFNKGKIKAEWGEYGFSDARIYLYLDGILLGEGVSFTHPSYIDIETCSKSKLEGLYQKEEEKLREYITDRLETTFEEYVSSLKRKRVKYLLCSLLMTFLGYCILNLAVR